MQKYIYLLYETGFFKFITVLSKSLLAMLMFLTNDRTYGYGYASIAERLLQVFLQLSGFTLD